MKEAVVMKIAHERHVQCRVPFQVFSRLLKGFERFWKVLNAYARRISVPKESHQLKRVGLFSLLITELQLLRVCNPLARSAGVFFWRFLEISGDFWRFWRFLEIFGDFWRFLEISEDFWRFLEISGDFLRFLEISGDCLIGDFWRFLEISGDLWIFLDIFGDFVFLKSWNLLC